MGLAVTARNIPGRVATGAYILHSGMDKWNGDEARADAIHAMAAGAFPVLKRIPPARFLRLLSVYRDGNGSCASLAVRLERACWGCPVRVLRGTGRHVLADRGASQTREHLAQPLQG